MRSTQLFALAGLAVVFGTGSSCDNLIVVNGPQAGAVFTSPGAVTIQAQSSLYALVSRVEFLLDGQIAGSDPVAPFSHTWNVAEGQNGPHVWVARAVLSDGSAIASTGVNVSVDIDGGVLEVTDPQLVGFLPAIGTAVDVSVVEDLAFVASAEFGVAVASVAGGEATGGARVPFEGRASAASGMRNAVLGVDSYGSTIIQLREVGPAGSSALLGEFSQAVDAADPADIAIDSSGTLVVAAMGNDGLWLVDFSAPGSPQLSSTFATPGYATGVALDPSGSFAFVTDRDEGFLVVRLDGPGGPSEIARISMPTFTLIDIAVTDGVAFLGNASGGVRSVSVANPYSPQLIGGTATGVGGLGMTVAADGNHLAVVGSGSSPLGTVLEVFDLGNPAFPTRTGSVHVTTPVADQTGITIAGGLAYVSAGAAGVSTYDLAPAEPTLSSTNTDSFRSLHIAGSSGLAVVLGEDSQDETLEIRVLEVDGSGHPSLLGRLPTGLTNADVGEVALIGQSSFAIATLGSAGVWIIDLSDPTDPVLETTLATSGSANAVAVDVGQSLAYVANGFGGLVVLDLSDLSQPSVLGSRSLSGYMTDVALGSGIAYLTNSYGSVRAVDVSDPSAPFLAGGTGLLMAGNLLTLDVEGDLMVVLGGIQLEVYDLTDPNRPVRTSTTVVAAELNAGKDVALADGRAFLATGPEGMKVYDLSDPASPDMVASVSMLGEANAIAIEASAGMACVADDLATVGVVALSNP